MRETQNQIVVRGLCACGKRYRIRHARPDASLPCPHCGAPVRVTAAAFQAAGGIIVEEIPEPEHASGQAAGPAEIPWAILIDRGELVVAPAGSQPGLTGIRVHESEESKLYEAMRGTARLQASYDLDARRSVGIEAWFTVGPRVERTLLGDLVASFYLAGSRRNAVLITISTLILSLLSFATVLPAFGLNALTFVLMLMGLIGLVVVAGTILQFFTSVLVTTAEGDDDIPLRDAEWNFADNVAWPIAALGSITAVCGLPAMIVGWYTPAGAENRMLLIGAAAAFGSLFWPIATMSVLVGGSLGYLRPDWLLRCIFRVGPTYLLAWLMVMMTAGIWWLTWYAYGQVPQLSLLMRVLSPFWLIGVNLYFGYVLFRNIGLVYRHFGDRLPKKLV